MAAAGLGQAQAASGLGQTQMVLEPIPFYDFANNLDSLDMRLGRAAAWVKK